MKCGRVSLAEKEAPEDMDPEQWAQTRSLEDPAEPRLKLLSSDLPVKGNSPAWSLRKGGDFGVYNLTQKNAVISHGVVILRSLLWPGSFTFYSDANRNQQIYFGDGLKFESKQYYPSQTPMMQEDPEERLFYVEPNPTEASKLRKLQTRAEE